MGDHIDNMLGGAITNAGNSAIGTTRKGDENRSLIKLALNLLLVLIIVGAEGMKVIFRNNFGKNGINLIRLLICSFCFGLVSYYAFKENHFGLDIDDSPSTSNSFFITGIIYAFLSAFILIKGIISKMKANKENPNSDYRGDSSLLGFLEDYGYNQNLIQNLAEPLYIIIIGVLFWFYNPVGSIPLVFCGLSVWVNILFDLLFGNQSIPAMQNELRTIQPQETITNQVIID